MTPTNAAISLSDLKSNSAHLCEQTTFATKHAETLIQRSDNLSNYLETNPMEDAIACLRRMVALLNEEPGKVSQDKSTHKIAAE